MRLWGHRDTCAAVPAVGPGWRKPGAQLLLTQAGDRAAAYSTQKPTGMLGTSESDKSDEEDPTAGPSTDCYSPGTWPQWTQASVGLWKHLRVTRANCQQTHSYDSRAASNSTLCELINDEQRHSRACLTGNSSRAGKRRQPLPLGILQPCLHRPQTVN